MLNDPSLHPLIIWLVFVLGLCIGSFLNVMALRFLADEPLSQPPSHCPKCDTPIRPIDNIPVLSWILLGGKCRSCKVGISPQYPLIELATGVLFAYTVWTFGVTWQSALLLFMMCNLVVIFITDLLDRAIFQINSFSLIPAGLVYSFFMLGGPKTTFPLDLGSLVIHVPDAFVSALIAIGIAVVFFEGMILLSKIFLGEEGFGHGDTHLMMGVGAYLGWPLTVLALFLGFVAQLIPAVPMLVYQWIVNKQWTSLISGAVATLSGLMPLLLMNVPMDESARTLTSLVCMGVSVIALVVFLKQIKNGSNLTYLPLGPALVIGSLIALFWGDKLIGAYQAFLAAR